MIVTISVAVLSLQEPAFISDHYRLVTVAPDANFEACGIADFDNDGILDIVSGDTIYTGPDWTAHSIGLIRSIGGYRVDFADIPCDVDQDGWIDVISCSWHDRGVFWRRNPGNDKATWKMQIIDQPGNMETALSVDVDNDGTPDFLPNIADKTIWYRTTDGTLERNVISESRGGHGIGIGDINNDGQLDALGPDGWFEAPKDPRKGSWVFHDEWTLGGASIAIIAHDFDQDGLTDVFWGMGHDYGLYWLKQGRDDDGKRTWTRHTVDESWSQAHGLVLIDLDQDGQPEILTGKRRYAHNGKDPGGEDALIVCTYSFDPATKRFEKEILSQGGRVGAGLYPVPSDLDKDGDIDIVLPGKSGLYILMSQRNDAPPSQ